MKANPSGWGGRAWGSMPRASALLLQVLDAPSLLLQPLGEQARQALEQAPPLEQAALQRRSIEAASGLLDQPAEALGALLALACHVLREAEAGNSEAAELAAEGLPAPLDLDQLSADQAEDAAEGWRLWVFEALAAWLPMLERAHRLGEGEGGAEA